MKNGKMKFVIIGITDNPETQLPPEAEAEFPWARAFSGGARHHEMVAHLLPKDCKWIDITVPLDRVFEQYRTIFADPHDMLPPTIIIFASGDPLFFGIANTIRRKMPEAEMKLYPAFNSLQMLAHRLLMPYHDLHIVSLTGRPWPELDRALIERKAKIGVLTDREHTPAAIARRMTDYGYTYYNIYVGEHLGNPDKERIRKLTLTEAAQQDYDCPNCLILHSPNTPPPPSYGIPDQTFALLDGREKMITKMPIRLLDLQALQLTQKHVLWDIGACTGSVSIEARQLFPHLQIEAFEIRPECEGIIHENMRRHRTPGIQLHMGDFLAADCDALAAPDAVFIGGHGGRLQEMMEKAVRYLSPDGCIVMNSVKAPRVLTDSQQLWDEACQQLGLREEPPLHIQLNDYHPITILKCKK